jgi:isoleucyl-tRNA synthetase
MAPVMPFYAEQLFQRVREDEDAVSIHLMAWPQVEDVDDGVIEEMRVTRDIVARALEARSKANIKVRQPLQTLWVRHEIHAEGEPFHVLIRDEVNIKEVKSDMSLVEEVKLDTVITPELKLEGEMRELLRAIQDARKELGLQPQDRIGLIVDKATQFLVCSFEMEVKKTVGAQELWVDPEKADRTLEVNGTTYRFGIVVG